MGGETLLPHGGRPLGERSFANGSLCHRSFGKAAGGMRRLENTSLKQVQMEAGRSRFYEHLALEHYQRLQAEVAVG